MATTSLISIWYRLSTRPIPLVWTNSPRVVLSLYSNTLSWFRVDQWLLNGACKCIFYCLCFYSIVAQTHNLTFEASTLPMTPVMWFGKLESDLYIVCVLKKYSSALHMRVKCQPSHLSDLMSWWSFKCQLKLGDFVITTSDSYDFVWKRNKLFHSSCRPLYVKRTKCTTYNFEIKGVIYQDM
jgi:hypothetical protein